MAGKIQEIRVPKWGMEMTEGVITGWNFKVGDRVDAGDALVDIETSKIVNSLSVHEAGTVRRLLADEGDTRAVGELIALLSEGDVSEAEIETHLGKGAPAPVDKPAPVEVISTPVASASLSVSESTAVNASGITISSVARRLAEKHGVVIESLIGTSRHGRIGKQDVEKALEIKGIAFDRHAGAAPGNSIARSDDSHVAASPVARRLAREAGINLNDCRATGRLGRVSKADVELAMLRAGKASTTVNALPRDTDTASAFIERPLGAMRRTIAARLQSSKQTAPHYRVVIDAELDALLVARRKINESNPGVKVSINDFLIKACATALIRVPRINIQFDGTTVREFSDADIAVAVALDDGLITPIVKRANRLGVIEIAERTADLGSRARAGKLLAAEFQGGSFCLSNLGMFGVRQFDAIINPPQCAILAAGNAEQRPIVRDGGLHIATMMTLTLSSDHRVIDGALAAQFMQKIKGFLESPATMLG